MKKQENRESLLKKIDDQELKNVNGGARRRVRRAGCSIRRFVTTG